MRFREVISKIFKFPLHTFLFAAFPIIFLYAYNIEETSISMTFKPLLVVLVGVAIFLFLAKLVFRNWLKAGLFISLGVLIFFSHGHIFTLIGALKYQIWKLEIGTVDILFMVWAVLLTGLFFVLLRTKRNLVKITGFLNFISLILVLYLLAISVPHEVRRLFASPESGGETTIKSIGEGIGYKPDIYYIILDRYDASRTLKDFYGYDNSYFTDFLEETGFYVAEDSFSNYPRTYLSLAASLNMVYHTSPMDGGPIPLVKEHELGKFLKSQGYRYFHTGSWSGASRTSPLADVNFEEVELYLDLDEFTLRLIETTAISPVLKKIVPGASLGDFHSFHRYHALYQFDRIKEVSEIQVGPKFFFAHILLPHDPYVFGPNCEPEDPAGSTIEMFLSNLSCTNKLVKEAVEEILENYSQPPVIVIQADEGHFAMKYKFSDGQHYTQADPRSLQERARILNSYYLPGIDGEKFLYPSITPVNSFRVILNLYFGTDLKLLPDRSYVFQEKANLYIYDFDGPIDFIDVTNIVK